MKILAKNLSLLSKPSDFCLDLAPPPPSRMATARFSSFHAYHPLPAAVPHPLSAIQQPPSPLVVFVCTIAGFPGYATADATSAPPSLGVFMGLCLVPWLAVRIRLREPSHRTAASPLSTGPKRDPPDLPPDCGLDPSGAGFFNSARPPNWLMRMAFWLNLCALRSTIHSTAVNLGGVPLSQSEPIDYFAQAGILSRPVNRATPQNQAVHQGQAVEPSRAAEPSRVTLLIQAEPPKGSTKISLGWHQVVCRMRSARPQSLGQEQQNEAMGSESLRGTSNKKKRGAEKELQEEDQEVQFFEPLEQA